MSEIRLIVWSNIEKVKLINEKPAIVEEQNN